MCMPLQSSLGCHSPCSIALLMPDFYFPQLITIEVLFSMVTAWIITKIPAETRKRKHTRHRNFTQRRGRVGNHVCHGSPFGLGNTGFRKICMWLFFRQCTSHLTLDFTCFICKMGEYPEMDPLCHLLILLLSVHCSHPFILCPLK